MSADNRICIMQTWTGQWAVWNGSGSAKYHEAPETADLFNTEAEATNHAHAEEERIGYVEYGVQRITPEEQMTALCYAIEDLGRRLVQLRTSGRQWKSRHEDNDE